MFHKHGYTQLHAVTLYGCCNYKYVIEGIPCMYDSIRPLDIYDYDSCKKVSVDFIGDNKPLIEYLNSIPDEIGLHGLFHSNYSAMSYEKQEHDIKEGLRLLHELFPNKKISTFIAPFNLTNAYTYEICKKYGLRVSALEGDHLEDMIHNQRGSIQFGQLYRYHHHRFYPESLFHYYDLSIEKLDVFLTNKNENKFVNSGGGDISLIDSCVKKYNAQNWYVYAYKDFDQRLHAFLPYEWIKNNIPTNKAILEVACGAGGMLWHLYKNNFTNLSGYDYDSAAINCAKEICSRLNYKIQFYCDNAIAPKNKTKHDVIVWVNGMYHLDNYSLEKFFEVNVPLLNNKGYILFDMVDASFNERPNNQFSSQDVLLPVNERRPSEYKLRYSKNEVLNIARQNNLKNVKYFSLKDQPIPRCVYVFQKKD